jgi:uncharacterized low-complexity protein
MERISKSEITAILALIGLSSAAAGSAQLVAQAHDANHMFVAEKASPASKSKDSACGKGSCGTDDKGAAAAKKAHAGKSTGKSAAKTSKTSSPEAKKPAASDNTTPSK